MNAIAITQPPHCSDEEWALRVQLAHCYHLVDFFGWTETIFNHISARLPGPRTTTWSTPSASTTAR